MADTSIEWTDKTWNPVVGCTKVSPGCKNCYAKTLHDLRHKAKLAGKPMPAQYAHPFEVVQLMPDRLTDPLSWRKPQRVFVNSVSDLFHNDVPFDFIDRVFAVMVIAHWHTFQVLTKRPDRMAAYFAETYQVPARPAGFVCGIDVPATPARTEDRWARINFACDDIMINSRRIPERCWTEDGSLIGRPAWPRRPLPNVWLGVSVENQAAADERIPHLLRTPAAVRFISCEPLLGPVNLGPWLGPWTCDKHDGKSGPGSYCGSICRDYAPYGKSRGPVDWVIVGGESGPDSRHCRTEWVRSIVEQCKAASVACFVKQLGANVTTRLPDFEDWPNHASGTGPVQFSGDGFGNYHVRGLRDKKGGDIAEWPADLRVREFPAVTTEETR